MGILTIYGDEEGDFAALSPFSPRRAGRELAYGIGRILRLPRPPDERVAFRALADAAPDPHPRAGARWRGDLRQLRVGEDLRAAGRSPYG